MEPQWERALSPAAKQAWSGLLRPLAVDLQNRASELSKAAVADVRGELPELFPDPESGEENRASTEASLRALAELMERGADPRSIELPPETLAYARMAVRRHIPFSSLLRSYRLAHEALWNVIFTKLVARAQDTAQLSAATELCSAWVFAYVDTALTRAEIVYEDERERWLRTAAAAHADTIDAILSGREHDPGPASKRLRYELDRRHVAMVAWLEGAHDLANPLGVLETAAAEVGGSIGADDSPLVHPLGLFALAAWVAVPAAPTLDQARFEPSAAAGVRMAIGEPHPGVVGFRRSHLEAGHARRVATLAARPAGTVTRYDTVTLPALATTDVDQARAFVTRQLGPLGGDDDASLRVAATLRVYLDEHASRGRAARRLGIHENTVRYRVRQAEEILGRSVEEDTLGLRVALALVEVVREREGGPPV